MPQGLFITGTDTGVGKTYVACLIARSLCAEGLRVGVYKPAGSGCRREDGALVCDDASQLWDAAGQPAELEKVCPQRFEAPLAPHVAAAQEGRSIDRQLLRDGLDYWHERSDVVIVEGVGGLLSPISEQDYNADLAREFGFPLVVVTRNILGTINQTLQTLLSAAAYRGGLPVAGVVLNDCDPNRVAEDQSVASNATELKRRCNAPLLAHVGWNATGFDEPITWPPFASRSSSTR